MAVDEACSPTSQFRAWRWLILFVLGAQLLRLLVPTFLAVSDPVNLLDDRAAWAAGPGVHLRLTDQGLVLRDLQQRGEGSIFASRIVPVADGAEMLSVRICLIPEPAATRAAGRDAVLLLASLRSGAPDFNRSYELRLLRERHADRCTGERFTRRHGDEQALVQLQLGPPEPEYVAIGSQPGPAVPRELSVAVLEVTSLREDRTWRWTRRVMLILGIALVTLHFYRYVPSRDRLLSVRGLLEAAGALTVAGIVFGCVASVPLKADIYALLTGGQLAAPSGATLDDLLVSAFPRGQFSIFTLLHAVLFAVAGTALGLAGRRPLPDLLLLAVVTETLQVFVPGRGPGVDDVLVDYVGVAVAAALLFLLRRPERIRLFLQE